MERQKFEASFKDAFEGAEVSPSEGLWTNIELDLEKAEGAITRRRLMFYKMLAAASVVFALGFAGIGYYLFEERPELFQQEIAGNASSEPATAIDKEVSKTQQANDGLSKTGGSNSGVFETSSSDHEPGGEQTIAKRSNIDIAEAGDATGTGNRVDSSKSEATFVGSDLQNSAESPISIPVSKGMPPSLAFNHLAYTGDKDERQLPSVYSPTKPELVFPADVKANVSEHDAGALLLARLADEEKQFAAADDREKDKKSERLWTSVGFAAGGFSSVNASVSPTASNQYLVSSNSTVADKQAGASGIAYSYGINMGARLSKRWVLQGGLNYLVQSSDYTATNVIGGSNFQSLKAESINALDQISQSPQVSDPNAANLLAPTFPYTVNNNVKFFSVPVQAGYLIVNRKFGLQMNAGISTDLFLQNTITPESGSLDKATQGRGEDSPYRALNFSGLMGTEFTYRFGQHYRVALNPGLRYPFNSVYKSDIGVESMPLTFDIGLRFRYIFH